jgi:hypothetical protein
VQALTLLDHRPPDGDAPTKMPGRGREPNSLMGSLRKPKGVSGSTPPTSRPRAPAGGALFVPGCR